MASLFTEDWVVGPQKTAFYERRYEPQAGITTARGLVLFIHGFAEHVGRYTQLFPSFSAEGVAVVAYDQRGYGRTVLDPAKRSKTSVYGKTTTREQMEDIAFFLRRTREWVGLGVPLFLVGQSMGGFEVLNFATSRLPEVAQLSGVVALSPLLQLSNPPSFIKREGLGLVALLLPSMAFDADVDPYKLSRDKSVGEAYIADPLSGTTGTLRGLKTMLDGADLLHASGWKSWPSALPLLVLHGTADEINSFPASKSFVEHVPAAAADKTFTPYEGGFHELMNELHPMREQAMSEVVQWVVGRSNKPKEGMAKL